MNIGKTKVVHYRKASVPRIQFKFECCGNEVDVVNEYKYLGVVLNETLDFTTIANILADFSGRAFSSIHSKMKDFAILDYEIYTKLFETCIIPIMDYSSAVWGYKDYPYSNAVQNRMI